MDRFQRKQKTTLYFWVSDYKIRCKRERGEKKRKYWQGME